MAPDLPEKLLGIDIDDADDGTTRDSDERDDIEYVRIVFFGVGEHRLAVPVDDVRTITDVPDEVTPVPRTPRAIEGVTDLRGDITAVIDPSIHFPTTEDRPGQEELLVFDRPSDGQSAAIRVDDVLSVDAIPEHNVLDAAAVESRDYSGDALEHPLVEAVVEQERDSDQRDGSVVTESSIETTDESSDPDIDLGVDTAADSSSGTQFDSRPGTAGSEGGREPGHIGEAVEIESIDALEESSDTPDEDGTASSDDEHNIIELIPMVDVDDLLLASGHTSSDT
ncbi:chemotaxis protein CheW [Halopiger djelfimassiliensis]|uniref:chemotaxis protein CheW n=1 Tax=Halopiger djelfimassiliensis TaxID=1293047 RepID=UPI0006780F70|nr:chemotaxis protein CheW [Halopiger djelfimassiliensis]